MPVSKAPTQAANKPASAAYPKREQRKQASRTALIGAAIELFGRKGFEETKLEDVAERAGLHVQTLYRHFANKRDLLTAVDEHFLSRFQEACAKRSSNTLAFWRAWQARATRHIVAGGARYQKSVSDIYAIPNFPTPYLRIWHEYEHTLSRSIAEDLGDDLEDARLPILIACQLWGGCTHVFREWMNNGGSTDLEAQTLAMIDLVISQYQHLFNDSAPDGPPG